MFSNYAETEYRRLAQAYGAPYFFDKAVDFPQLFALLQERAGR